MQLISFLLPLFFLSSTTELRLGQAFLALGNPEEAHYFLTKSTNSEAKLLLATLSPPNQALALLQPLAQDHTQDPLFLENVFTLAAKQFSLLKMPYQQTYQEHLASHFACLIAQRKGETCATKEPPTFKETTTIPQLLQHFPKHPLRELAAQILEQSPKSTLFEELVAQQEATVALTKQLPFVDPYQNKLGQLPLSFQRRLLTLKEDLQTTLLQEQEKRWKEQTLCPDKTTQEILASLEQGFTYASLAEKKLVEQKLPFVEVIPLQEMALAAFLEAERKATETVERTPPQEALQSKQERKETEALREMLEQDEEAQDTVQRAFEGKVW